MYFFFFFFHADTKTIYDGYGNGFEGLHDLELEKAPPLPPPLPPPLGLCHDDSNHQTREDLVENKNVFQEKENNNNVSKTLTKEIISQYFYMPITRAAKELNVGLTLLKKRCRELGIQRWPHRKLMSLQTLIRNVQVI